MFTFIELNIANNTNLAVRIAKFNESSYRVLAKKCITHVFYDKGTTFIYIFPNLDGEDNNEINFVDAETMKTSLIICNTYS